MRKRFAKLRGILQTEILSRERHPWLGWVSLALFSGATVGFAYQGYSMWRYATPWGMWFWAGVSALCAAGDAHWLIQRQRRRRRAGHDLRARLAGRCTRCGYDTRGNPSPTRPECGAYVGHRGRDAAAR